jgi:hypothetical protein
LPWSVEVVSQHGEDCAVAVDHGDGLVAQPDMFLLANSRGAVFAEQMTCLVVGVRNN